MKINYSHTHSIAQQYQEGVISLGRFIELLNERIKPEIQELIEENKKLKKQNSALESEINYQNMRCIAYNKQFLLDKEIRPEVVFLLENVLEYQKYHVPKHTVSSTTLLMEEFINKNKHYKGEIK